MSEKYLLFNRVRKQRFAHISLGVTADPQGQQQTPRVQHLRYVVLWVYGLPKMAKWLQVLKAGARCKGPPKEWGLAGVTRCGGFGFSNWPPNHPRLINKGPRAERPLLSGGGRRPVSVSCETPDTLIQGFF